MNVNTPGNIYIYKPRITIILFNTGKAKKREKKKKMKRKIGIKKLPKDQRKVYIIDYISLFK